MLDSVKISGRETNMGGGDNPSRDRRTAFMVKFVVEV